MMSKKINLIILIHLFNSLSGAGIGYSLSGGRLGDNLISDLHATWLSFKYNIPVIYNPFEYADQLKLSKLEQKYKAGDFEKIVSLADEKDIDPQKNILYVVPYFSEDATEFRMNPNWIYFKVDWNNPVFKEKIKKTISPLAPPITSDFKLPKDRTTVAVHVRLGGCVDLLLFPDKSFSCRKKSWGDYANIVFPLKFPSLDFYVEQIKRLSSLLDHKPLYVYIFTDDSKPMRVVKKIKKHFNQYDNIVFDCRKRGNAHNKNVLTDFFALTKFDCLIRASSNYALTASKLANYTIEIFPLDYRLENNFPVISKIGIINKNSTRERNTIKMDSSFPYISGNSFRALADHVFDETTQNLNPQKVKTGDIIFLKTDYMDKFFSTIHPHISTKYILITHNSDYSAPGKFSQYLDDQKIIHWFGINADTTHPKFTPIPIGIANKAWNHGKLETFDKILMEKNIKKTARPILLGINFNADTNKSRALLIEKVNSLKSCKNISSPSHEQYLINMTKTKFVPSPRGNGLDCHRTWEAALMGAIPIVETSDLDSMFEDLPVLIIKDWNQITTSFLHKKYKDLKRKNYNTKKMYFTYWQNLIHQYKNH